jgi:hypothetical protein
LLKLRQKECLLDTWGHARQPADLLRRTPETEALLDVEPFVKAELDTEAVRPLLVRLGVRDTPTGPDRLLDRLHALSTVKNPPLFEVQKWCHRLDALLPKCTPAEFQRIRNAFQSQRLILAMNGTWARADEVFLSPDDFDVPDPPVVHDSINPLRIWSMIGVEARPTLERVLDWLRKLPRNEKLAPDILRRVKELLARHAHRIWLDCGCWLNLEGELIAVAGLRYSISMNSVSDWGHLFPSIRKQIADFQRLPSEVVHDEPFSRLPSLGSVVHERMPTNQFFPGKSVIKPWLRAFGSGLSRIVTDTEERTQKIRELAARLAKTAWHTTGTLETVPYLDGTPVGTARPITVLWDGSTLFIIDRPVTSLLRQIARELARPFNDPEIEDAIKFCIDRTSDHVIEYLEENFTLAKPHDSANSTALPDAAANAESSRSAAVASRGSDGAEQNGAGSEVPGDTPDGSVSRPASVETGEPASPGMANPADGWTSARLSNPRPRSQSLIDRFALTAGFTREENGERYFHPDGRWIQKQAGIPYPWQMYSRDGQLVKSMLVREHSLVREPLEIASEVWEACRKEPTSHSLIVVTVDGEPQELTGTRLVGMVKQGKLDLCAASYRVVCSVDQDELSELPNE